MAPHATDAEIKDTAENALLFMLTGKQPVHLPTEVINEYVAKAYEISQAFHAYKK